jgi:hypothetical protein
MRLIKNLSTLFACACLASLFTGCASVLCGSKQSFSFDTKPAGAEVLVYNSKGDVIFRDATPCVAELPRTAPEKDRANYVVLMRKQGYSGFQVPLTSEINNAYFANILFGGVGLAVDPLTGAMWTLRPTGVNPKLLEGRKGFRVREDELFVTLKSDVPNTLAAQNEAGQ